MSWEIIKPDTHIDFIGKRRLCLMLSGALIVASIVAIPIRGIRLGIDFAGGTEVQLAFAPGVPASDGAIREVLTDALDVAEPSVVRYGEAGSNEYLVRFRGNINVADEDEAGQGAAAGAAADEGDSDVEGSDRIVKLGQALEGAIGPVDIERVEFVGPRVGAELREDGLLSLLFASIAILIYVALRFNARYAPGAIVAVIHDLAVTAGVFVILGLEFDLRILAALLAILGYSLNDTIIIYDRIRENMELHTSLELPVVLNESVNQTLSRTILTSGTTLIALLSLYFLGGPVIRPFAFAMLLGIVVGTYSSIYIASPVFLWLEQNYGQGAARERATRERKQKAKEQSGGERDKKTRKSRNRAGKGKRARA